jgi:hypothetical protein
MEDHLIYTDTRPRARSTGHAFGFEGNLGMPVIISAMISVFIVTMLLNSENKMPLFLKFAVALLPTIATAAYILLLRNRKPPCYDKDLIISFVNGRTFQPARHQPRHPLF